MNVFGIENQRVELLYKLESVSSLRRRLLIYYRFFNRLLGTNNDNIINSFLVEFIDSYLTCLSAFEPFFISPQITHAILNQAETIAKMENYNCYKHQLYSNIIRIKAQLDKLIKVLKGDELFILPAKNIAYPLLEEDENGNDIMTGVFNSFNIIIAPSKNENSFIVVPDYNKIKGKIELQLTNSWEAALNQVQHNYGKINQFHRVIIRFNELVGVYDSGTLGTALTLGFMQELVMLYKLKPGMLLKENVIVTGGMDSNGNLLGIPKESIERKVECVFYSDAKIFVVPNENKDFAEQRLLELKKDFPKRNLGIVSVESLGDLMNRRNLIDFTKTNVARRIFKNIRNTIVQN